jgi:hypothetical protein
MNLCAYKVWNSIVPAQTVVIKELPQFVSVMGASAITGHIPDDWPIHSPREGRHKVLFYPGAKGYFPDQNFWIANVAHQRPDCDHYIRFSCE